VTFLQCAEPTATRRSELGRLRHTQRGARLSQIVGEAVLISTGMGWKYQIQSRPRRAYLASCLLALRWEIFGALGTVGTVLYVLGGTFADIVWSAIAAVIVALLIATFREAMTWFRCAP